MRELLTVKLHLGPTGSDPGAVVEVGGVNLADWTEEVTLTSRPGDLTRLTLTLSGVAVDYEGSIAPGAMPEAYKKFIEIVGDSIAGHVAEGETK